MLQTQYARWLEGPAFTGWQAHLAGALVVAVPTIARVAINGWVTGCEFTPYLPFVLLAAILLRWWQAAGVALASVAIMGGLLAGPANQHLMSECFISATSVFLAGSAVTIGAVVVMRRALAASQAWRVAESADGIVFSLKDDGVWASWHGSDQPVRLGSQEKVEYMMADFLAQGELGRRLSGQRNQGHRTFMGSADSRD
jgi:hypothetical protein